MDDAVIETARLRLRELEPEGDAGFILQLLNEPGFLQNIGDREVRTAEQAARYIADVFVGSYAENGFGLYAVERREDGAAVGICGLVRRDWLEDVDVGFAVLQRWYGHGYASEAALATVRWAREALGIERVVGIVTPGNAASIAVLKKLGLRFEGLVTAPGKTAPTELYVPG